MSEFSPIMNSSEDKFKKAIQHLEDEMIKIRAGKANPNMLHGIMVEAYGSMTPISGVCNISAPDPRSLVLQPWDKTQIPEIEKAIMMANIGLNPQNDGEIIRIIIPPLTEERRKDLVKQAKAEVENTKVSIRNIRREANDEVKALKDDGVSEDMIKKGEDQVQKMTNDYTAQADKILEVKEKEIMTV